MKDIRLVLFIAIMLIVSGGMVAPLPASANSSGSLKVYINGSSVISIDSQAPGNVVTVPSNPEATSQPTGGDLPSPAVTTNAQGQTFTSQQVSAASGPPSDISPNGPVLVGAGSSEVGQGGPEILATAIGPVLVTTTSFATGSLSSVMIVGTYSLPGLGYQPPQGASSAFVTIVPDLWLDTSKKRTRSKVYIEILELIKERGPLTPFEISFYARLNHQRGKQYAEFLKQNGYLQLVEEEGKKMYILTRGGLVFSEKVKDLFIQYKTPTEVLFSAMAKQSEVEVLQDQPRT